MPASAKAPAPLKPSNVFAKPWRTPFAAPPFSKLETGHFKPAFKSGMAAHAATVKAIAEDTRKPTFANTLEALEKSSAELSRVSAVFFNLTATDSNEELRAIERDLSGKLSKHWSDIYLNAKLFARIQELFEKRDRLRLSPEQDRLLERTHTSFVNSGAKLNKAGKKRVAVISARLSELATQFIQNVLAAEQAWHMKLKSEADLAGLPDGVRSAARQAAIELGLKGEDTHAVTLARSSVESFLTFSDRRDLREKAFKAWVKRAEKKGPEGNPELLSEAISLRQEMAQLLGFDTYADYALSETMAKRPEAVFDLLSPVWEAAKERATEERDALQARASAAGQNEPLEAWDWRYYAEKERKARFDVDASEVRPYLELNNVINAAFYVAGRLFGLQFKELPDADGYHPDVRVFEVTDAEGSHVALFYGDYFARPSKRSGAWMSAFRRQQAMGAKSTRPIIVNVMNFSRGAEGEPSLLSFDDAETLFHEFGHGLHGMLSNVRYPSLSGTSVSRDFVELPSQLYEHWLSEPDVLRKFALHYKTGKPIPKALLQRVLKAQNFNQGFATVEYTACALVDMDLHAKAPAKAIKPSAFEKATLKKYGMPPEIVMRHRLPHFMHIMGGYSAGYYSYMWSEVMDADAFAAFKEAGDIFDPKTAQRLKDHIYSSGNTNDPEDAYLAFRGRQPSIKGLLKQRGFAT